MVLSSCKHTSCQYSSMLLVAEGNTFWEVLFEKLLNMQKSQVQFKTFENVLGDKLK